VVGTSLAVDAAAPPAGVTFSADGTRIIIAKTAIPASWVTGTISAATIRLTTAANTQSTTPAITVQP